MPDDPLTCSARESSELIGCGKNLFYAMAADGRLGPTPVLGGRYDRQEIIDWVRQGRCCPREKWLQRSEDVKYGHG
ncbi:MAG: hypothetical protein ACYSSN_08665 [Planctomycetota bacterium]|jgi:hypothetical protein